MKNIITISREFGSGGHFIGECIAEELHIPFYDREIIFQVAQKTGLAETYIAEHGEYAPKGGLFSYSFVGRDLQGSSVDDYIYQAQQTILRELAQQESCVMIGRCADYILWDRKDVLNVFIYGEQSSKCRRIMELYQKTEKEALALMKETDKKRRLHYSYHTEQKWGMPANYALCLSSSLLGYSQCVSFIRQAFSR